MKQDPATNRIDQCASTANRRGLSAWLFAGALVLVAAALSYFVLGWLLGPTLPAELVGEWRIVGGEMDGARLTFARDGSFTATLMVDGKPSQMEATVEKQGGKLRYTMVTPDGRTMTKSQTIKLLTEWEMIIEENRQQSRLMRIAK